MTMQAFYTQLKSSPPGTALQSALRALCEPAVAEPHSRDGWCSWDGASPATES